MLSSPSAASSSFSSRFSTSGSAVDDSLTPCLDNQRLTCINSRIVVVDSRLRCLVIRLPEILNSRSTPAELIGTEYASRAIFANVGYKVADDGLFHHSKGFVPVLSRGPDIQRSNSFGTSSSEESLNIASDHDRF